MAKEIKKAGRPQKFGSESKILTIRVPKVRFDHYKEIVKNFIKLEESRNVSEM